MGRVDDLHTLVRLLKEFDLPVSPILEYAIKEKIDECAEGNKEEIPISPVTDPIDRTPIVKFMAPVSETARKNRKRTILRVTRADGSTIEDSKATVTLAITIKEIGVEKVRALNLTLDGKNLILVGENTLYPSQQYDLGEGYYLNTHSSTERKKYHLEKIFKALQPEWKVEIVSSLW